MTQCKDKDGNLVCIHETLEDVKRRYNTVKDLSQTKTHEIIDFLGLTHWYTSPSDNIQASVMMWNPNKSFKPHKHLTYDRVGTLTQEVMICISGKMRYSIWADDKQHLVTSALNPGDILIVFRGYHDYEILDENTIVYEVKNGPFNGVSNDKEYL